MLRHRKLLIILADGEHARLIRPAHNRTFETVAQFDSVTAHQRSSDLGSDRPGASMHSGSTAHHAIEPRTDPHAKEKHRFARLVADEVNRLVAANEYHELAVVAPTRALADLQQELSSQAMQRVIGTLSKDLIKSPIRDVWDQVHHWIGAEHVLAGPAE